MNYNIIIYFLELFLKFNVIFIFLLTFTKYYYKTKNCFLLIEIK